MSEKQAGRRVFVDDVEHCGACGTDHVWFEVCEERDDWAFRQYRKAKKLKRGESLPDGVALLPEDTIGMWGYAIRYQKQAEHLRAEVDRLRERAAHTPE